MDKKKLLYIVRSGSLIFIGFSLIMGIVAFYRGNHRQMTLICLPEKNEQSLDSGVRISEIYVDDKKIDFQNLALSDGWEITPEGLLAGYQKEQEISLDIEISGGKEIRMVYIKQKYLGKMEVIAGKEKRMLDLYENTEWNTEEIKITLTESSGFIYIVTGIFMWIIFIICGKILDRISASVSERLGDGEKK